MNKIHRSLLALLLCAVMATTGCTTAWVTEAGQIVAVLVPAATNIIALVATLQGKNISTQDLQLIQSSASQATADIKLIQSLIDQYQKADASAQPGILSEIQTYINTVHNNLSALLPALHIKDAATQAKITAIVGIVLSEVQSLAAIVPIVNPNTSKPMLAMAVRHAKTHPPLTASEFARSYNSTLTAKTGNPELDKATAGLKLPAHSKVTRWATLGLLK